METSILAPVIYLVIVVGGLFTFSSMYRKRYARQQLEPYFPSHPERDAYVTLLQKTDPPTPDAVLKAALIQRACADVKRVLRLREDKPAVQALLQKGCVGDDLWTSVNAAEKEVEAEILEVMHEANSFLMGWGQFIFNSAGEMVQNELTRKMMERYPQMRADAERKARGWKVQKEGTGTSGIKAEVKIETPSLSPSPAPAAPSPASPEPSTSTLASAGGPAPETPSPKSVAATLLNGKLAPPNAGNDSESVGSMSDGELVSAPGSPAKQGQGKKGGKKNKKRK